MNVFLLAIALAITSADAKPANYAGAWSLDKTQSKGLPGYYEIVKAHRLNITQDDQHLNVAVEIDIGQPSPDKIDLVYNLDGVETKTESPVRTQNGPISVPTLLKATVDSGGAVHITITRDIPMGGQSIHAVTTEDWTLGKDGKTLNVHRIDNSPRGKVDADMVFVRS